MTPRWGFLSPPPALQKSLVFGAPRVSIPAQSLIGAQPSKPASTEELIRSVRFERPAAPRVSQRVRWSAPKGAIPQILVIDEDSLLQGSPRAVEGAEISWISAKSGLHSLTGANGLARVPYSRTIAGRFVVSKPGFLPALGYAVAGTTTPIVLYRESRLGPILKSLGVVPDSERVLAIGKILDRDLKPLAGFTIDAALEAPFRTYYSLGSFGLFHPAATATGAQGDFVLSGLREGLQYLMPSTGRQEWPAWIYDTRNLPPIVTVTLADGTTVEDQTAIIDAIALERPESAVHVSVGGSRGLFLPNDEGDVKFDNLKTRASSEILEIRGEGYLTTWLNTPAYPRSFPSTSYLFTSHQLDELFAAVREADPTQGVVLGNLRAEDYAKPVEVRVYGNDGRRLRDAQVWYFDADNRLDRRLEATDPLLQNFAITNLAPGEWHVVVVDTTTGRGLSMNVVRVEPGIVSQIQF